MDTSGYLSSLTEVSLKSSWNATYDWKGGNFTGYGNEIEYGKIEYGNERWPDNYIFMMPFHGSLVIGQEFKINWELVPAGYYGKKPNYLPKKIKLTNTTTFNYTIEDGYPTKIRTNTISDGSGPIEKIITLVWS